MATKQLASCSATLVIFSLLALSASAIPLSRRKSMNTIKALNYEGPYIGLLTVYPTEEDAFFSTGAFKPHPKHPFVDLSGRRFRVGKVAGKRVIYVRCGVGMVNAAAVTQQMLDLFDIVGIIHFGISGNANNSLSIGDVVIPDQFAHTGIWDWVNPNGTIDSDYVAELNFGDYNLPEKGINLLGRIAFRYEQLFSDGSEKPNTFQQLFWIDTSKDWLKLAAKLQGMELEQCVNPTKCLPERPKVVVGVKGSTGNFFVDNAAYRNFLYETFSVSSLDMESSAVVMTSLSNNYPVIVVRALSDLAGGQPGDNTFSTFGPLAAINAANVVIKLVKLLPLRTPLLHPSAPKFSDQ